MLTILLALTALASDPDPHTVNGKRIGPVSNPEVGEPAAKTTRTDATRGMLSFDANLPAEILVDGQKVAQLFRAASLDLEVASGVRSLRIYTNGSPEELDVVVPAGGSLQVLIGRTGLSIDQASTNSAPLAVATGDVPVQVRMAGPIGARLYLDKGRYQVSAGEQLELELPVGDHVMSVRNETGTVVWASGTLAVTGPEPVVVQLSEGRLPEISGRGSFSNRQ